MCVVGRNGGCGKESVDACIFTRISQGMLICVALSIGVCTWPMAVLPWQLFEHCCTIYRAGIKSILDGLYT